MTKRSYKIFQIDAFADDLFKGNPAAVVILDEWIENAVMQSIAAENNLSETAFIVTRPDHYEITWFTPMSEIDLCGHATLSAAHVIFQHLAHEKPTIQFKTRQVGDLFVSRDAERIILDFPSRPPERITHIPDALIEGLGVKPDEAYLSRDYMLVYPNSNAIRNIKPDYKRLAACEKFVIVTAKASPDDGCDFVSRFFCAGDGIEEDPVTGSAHCNLIPFWAEQLGKTEMVAKQLSPRGGTLYCQLKSDRVLIGGRALTYLEGVITV